MLLCETEIIMHVVSRINALIQLKYVSNHGVIAPHYTDKVVFDAAGCTHERVLECVLMCSLCVFTCTLTIKILKYRVIISPDAFVTFAILIFIFT